MKRIAAAVTVFLLSASVHAAEYLGLDLGNASKEDVVKILKADKADFEEGFGYKGYSELPSIRVKSFARFDKLGNVDEAWLYFSPKNKLYKINVVYSDAGETYKVLGDALDSKYGKSKSSGFGFNSENKYRDKQATITLLRNTFGFGDDQKTTLAYEYTPFEGEIRQTRLAIEQDIKQKNALKVSGDL